MPKPKPVEFKTVKQLRRALGSRRVQKEFKSFFKKRYDSLDELIAKSVGTNTVRAFHHSRHGIQIGPLKTYRELSVRLVSREFSRWRKIKNRNQMHDFILNQARRFRADWMLLTSRRGYKGYDIGIGRAAKLLNLLLKYLTLWSKVSKQERKRIVPLLGVPLDSYTLQGVRRLYEGKLPRNASMGFIKTKSQYVDLQECIFRLCAPGYIPVEYEIAAWDASH